MENQPFRVRPWLLGVVLFVATVAIFSPSITGPYLFDDRMLIEGNDRVHSFAHWYRWLTGTIWETNYDPSNNASGLVFWRPLLLASFAFDWHIGAGSPFPFHLTNLLLHATNAVLVWLLFRKWFKSRGLAFGLALLFALHPVQTEVVCWISGRGDSLCLLGLLIAIHGVRSMGRHALLGTVGLLFGGLLAFSAKEMAVVLPIFVILDRGATSEAKSFAHFGRTLSKPVLIAITMVAGYLVWRSVVFDHALGQHESGNLSELLPLEAFGRALSLLFWPFDMTLGRAVTQSSAGVLFPRYDYVLLGASILVLGSVLAWRGRKMSLRLSVGWICFLACWFPVSGLISHGELALISPRYLYIPIVPAFFMLGTCLERIRRKADWTVSRSGTFLAVGVAFALLSFSRSLEFSSLERFWKAEIVQNPHYVSAQGYYIVRELRENRPRSALRFSLAYLESNRRARFDLLNAELEFHVLEALAAMTPDIQRGVLSKLSQYCDALVRGGHEVLELPELGVRLGDSHPTASEWIGKYKRLLIVSADVLSRLGEDKKATSRAERALKDCDHCWTLFGRSGVIFARAGKLGDALALADAFDTYASPNEKGQLHKSLAEALSLAPYLQGAAVPPVLIANYYSSLQAFGRAYAAAHDAFENPPEDPESQKILAELALRAGDVEAARKMLRRSMSPNEVEAWEREKLKSVLWHDAEIPEGTWIPNVRGDGSE